MKSAVRPFILVVIALLTLLPGVRGQTGATVTTLYSFPGTYADGLFPVGVVQSSDGNFYGTTNGDGDNTSNGTVFRITPTGRFTTLHTFNLVPDGAAPNVLVPGGDGSFYGTTRGDDEYSYGTVFQITAAGVLTTLHSFTGIGAGTDGAVPGTLVQGGDGNFYGTTSLGGSNGHGTVFQITPAGVLTTLHSFGLLDNNTYNSDGIYPAARLVLGSDGNFYGTTGGGGSNGNGTFFQIAPTGAFTTLYNFTIGVSVLVQGGDGNFYGTTAGSGGYGAISRITPAGVLTTLYTFTDVGTDGSGPDSLIQGADGNFYGTTVSGGSDNAGTVFELTPAGVLTTLYSFTGRGTDGLSPDGLVQSSDGNFYGTTRKGGSGANAGTVFKLTLTPTPTPTPTPVPIPAITSGTSASAQINLPFNYQIAATNAPVTFGASGLPAGLTVNPASGLISGTPTAAGVFNVALYVTNAGGTSTGALTLTLSAPTVNLAPSGSGTVTEGGAAGIVIVTRTGDTSMALTVSYKVKGSAKAGVDFKGATGKLVIQAGSSKAKLKLKTLAGDTFEGTRVAKVVLLPAADGSYAPGAKAVAKVKFVSAP